MRKCFFILAMAGISSVAVAQNNNVGYENVSGDKYEVFTNKFWDNWFISAGGGASILIGNRDSKADFGDRLSPTLNVAVGKWFTPGIGLRLQYSGLQAKGQTTIKSNPYINGGLKDGKYYEQKFDYGNLHGDILFNLSAMIGGYNPDRVYEVIPYLGAGGRWVYSGPKTKDFTVNGGIINRFRVSPALDVNLELSVMATGNKFDQELGGKKDMDGTFAATLGLAYRFKTRDFKKPQAARQIISEAELRDIRSRVNALASENQSLKQELATKPKTVVEVEESVVKAPDIAPRAVFFSLGSAKVSPQELINLGFLADQMKQWPDLRFKLVGYADSATGSQEVNKRLSMQRAQAVVDALVGTYGISRDRMTYDAVGGVSKFEKEYLNRMVQIDVVKENK